MSLDDLLFTQLTRDEASRLKPYRDNSTAIGFEGRPGKVSIGIGRNLDDVGISIAERDMLARNDIATAKILLSRTIPWSSALDDARKGVLLNMVFNEGIGHVLGFRKMLAALQVNDFTTAANEMENSKWYAEVKQRAVRLVTQMRTGVWQ